MSTTSSGHRLVPVSKDIDDPPDSHDWRCAGCGTVASWPGASVFDVPCPAASLFDEGAA